MRLDPHQLSAGEHRFRVGFTHRLQQDGMQVGAVDVPGRVEAAFDRLALVQCTGQERTATVVCKGDVRHWQRSGKQCGTDAERGEAAARARADGNAGADFGQRPGTLMDAHAKTGPQQRKRGRQPAQASANDRDGPGDRAIRWLGGEAHHEGAVGAGRPVSARQCWRRVSMLPPVLNTGSSSPRSRPMRLRRASVAAVWTWSSSVSTTP